MDIQVVIIGGGLFGLLLLQFLNCVGVVIVVFERFLCDYVLLCIWVGILEWGMVQMLCEVGVVVCMDCEGLFYDGCYLIDVDLMVYIDFCVLIGKQVMVYGQIEVMYDFYDVQDVMGMCIVYGVQDVIIYDLDQLQVVVEYMLNGQCYCLICVYVVGCDGFYGVSCQIIFE